MKRHALAVLSLILLAAYALDVASAETISITIGSSDPIDIDPNTATIPDLPGPDGKVSFSEAMIAANNTAGADTIGFRIPQSDWTFQWLYPGRAVVRSINDYYWRAYEAVTIDGKTQTAFTGDTNPDGAEVVLMSGHPYLNADDCAVLGLDSSSITFTASNGLAEGNTGTTGIEIFGGSGTLIRDNQGGTLKIDRSSDNVVVGNTFVRARVLGWIDGGQPAVNNLIGGPGAEDRNYIVGMGTWSSEGYPGGYALQLFNAIGTVVENNWIGTTPDGMAQGHQATTQGIWLDSENHDTTIRGNRIAGILGHGIGPHFFGIVGWAILIDGTGSGVTITGNTIGLNAADEAVLGSVTGIDVATYYYPTPPTGVRIGGAAAGEGNVIAGHRFNGITVGKDVAGARISGNSIYGNVALGVDLVTPAYGYGVTLNDALDADAGGNGLQNFPEITEAVRVGAGVRIRGSFHSSPSSQFTLEFFASESCDPNGHGEGTRYLGSSPVSTDGAGNTAFDVVLAATVEDGWVATATAMREPAGATSEFSACVPVTGTATDAPQLASAGAAEVRVLSATPNPFAEEIAIRYELGRPARVRLAIVDVSGRRVRVLADEEQTSGVQRVPWDGRDDRGERVAGGVYFFRLLVGTSSRTGRVVLVR